MDGPMEWSLRMEKNLIKRVRNLKLGASDSELPEDAVHQSAGWFELLCFAAEELGRQRRLKSKGKKTLLKYWMMRSCQVAQQKNAVHDAQLEIAQSQCNDYKQDLYKLQESSQRCERD